jgi:DNA-binding NarL/FixJ family response regulator
LQTSSSPPTPSARIMIVEDDAIVALDLSLLLESRGHRVVGTARSAAEALALADRTRPEIALMDVNLHGPGDGIQAADALSREGGPAVVFVTAYRDNATLQRALAARPHGFIAKPFDADALHAAVEFALFRMRSEAALAEQRSRAAVAEQLAQTRADFLSHMSHELRTPLNAILGFGQLLELQLAGREAEAARQARFIVEAGEQLLGLVDELLAQAPQARPGAALPADPRAAAPA